MLAPSLRHAEAYFQHEPAQSGLSLPMLTHWTKLWAEEEE